MARFLRRSCQPLQNKLWNLAPSVPEEEQSARSQSGWNKSLSGHPAVLPVNELWASIQRTRPVNTRKESPAQGEGSPGHIFGVVPAFKVSYRKGFTPLTPAKNSSNGPVPRTIRSTFPEPPPNQPWNIRRGIGSVDTEKVGPAMGSVSAQRSWMPTFHASSVILSIRCCSIGIPATFV